MEQAPCLVVAAGRDALEESRSIETQCCVCFLPTAEQTPCGHALCCPCHHALKSRQCPMCRRSLPLPAQPNFAAMVREAPEADLPGLHRAYRIASRIFRPEATKAKESILGIIVERISDMALLGVCDALHVIPLQEPAVWKAIGHRLDALADKTMSLRDLEKLACHADPLRQASSALETSADRAVARAAERIVASSSLGDLCKEAACLGSLISYSCVDGHILALYLHDALQRGLEGSLSIATAKDFACLVELLTPWHLFSDSMEAYTAHVFTARMSNLIYAGGFSDLAWIEEEVLAHLPSSQIWTEASGQIMREVMRQTERLVRLGSEGCLRSAASYKEKRREERVQVAMQSMASIDAEIARGIPH